MLAQMTQQQQAPGGTALPVVQRMRSSGSGSQSGGPVPPAANTSNVDMTPTSVSDLPAKHFSIFP